METEKESNQEEKESEEEKMEEEAEVKKDDLLLDLDPGDDDGGEIEDIVTEELLSSQVDQKDTELSDRVSMDHNENNPSNITEAKSDESHQAHQTNHLHKTSDDKVNMDDEREQESENDSPVTDEGEEEHEEKKTGEREVEIVAEVLTREPVQLGVDLRDREVKDKIHISEIPVHLHV